MKRISFISLVFFFTCSLSAQQESGLPAGAMTFTDDEINLVLRARAGSLINLPSVDRFTANEREPLEFEKLGIYAQDAQIIAIGEHGAFQLEPAERHFFLASNSSTGLGLAVNTKTGKVKGYAMKGGVEVAIEGNLLGELNFVEVVSPANAEVNCGLELDNQPGQATAFLESTEFPSQSAAGAGAGIEWLADVAVDTDTEWMAHFGNNAAQASAWIEDLFLSMNVMFERDVATRLLIGEVILRTGSDPYNVNSSNHANHLDEFAQYWRLNQGGIQRDFAAMLSGRNIGANSFSGIAWLNQYCQNGYVPFGQTYTVGSYSFNAIGANWPAASAARLVGHELGHNMGSPHTHCLSNGQDGFVDNCYSGEGSGCYSGPSSCPAAGSGTTMSYCTLIGGCGSTADFHPIVQNLLEDRLAANSPDCITPPSQPGPSIFANGFE